MPQIHFDCQWCDGTCKHADLGPLLDSKLRWFWEQMSQTADRRGDPDMVNGNVMVKVPESVDQRAAVGGLLGGRELRPGQQRSVSLEALTAKLQVRGQGLTPGIVAAHATQRRLAVRAKAKVQRQNREVSFRDLFLQTVSKVAAVGPNSVNLWTILKTRGTIGRLLNSPAPEELLSQAVAVINALPVPGQRMDRRYLANQITRNPHALDHGAPLATIVMAMLAGADRIEAGLSPRTAWAAVGVDCDNVIGGLSMLGISPVDWKVPPSVIVTIPPRVLSRCEWSLPSNTGEWVFVTENPSILHAAAERAEQGANLKLICTCGTPSAVEIGALERLSRQGWRMAVRADFDLAGIEHTRALLNGISGSCPWRMSSADYLESIKSESGNSVKLTTVPDTPWDSELAASMRRNLYAGFEESLLDHLLQDMSCGRPNRDLTDAPP